MSMTAAARHEAVEAAIVALADSGAAREAIQLPYKDGHGGPYPVIRVPVGAVLFNPRSHRIKSQLESHPKRQLVIDDPFSDEAQHVIHELLVATEGFEPLKANIAEYGQRDPGVVTRDGLLVNANTRLAALRELDSDYVRAAVLPSDADEHAIDRLELELQVQKDFKQDYTFTNELIFINELLNSHGYGEEKAAKALNWAASSDDKELKRGVERVRQSVRLYALVRYIQALSKGAIPLTFLDDKRQALIDLDDKYESLKGSDPRGAERMKNVRILGILTGNGYRELRKIDGREGFDTLVNRLEEKDTLGDEVGELVSSSTPSEPGGPDDDTDLLGGAEAIKDDDEDASRLVEVIAQSHGQPEIELPSGKTVVREKVVDEIAEAVDEAAEDVHAVVKLSKNINGPIRALGQAVNSARVAADLYKQVHRVDGFENGKFKYTAGKLRTQLAALEKLIEQHSQ